MAITTISAGQPYNLVLYTPGLLPLDVSTCTVLAEIADYDVASRMASYDIAATHAAMYSTLPVNTPSSASALSKFYLVSIPSGDSIIVAREWINLEASSQVNVKGMTIAVLGAGITSQHIKNVTEYLRVMFPNSGAVSIAVTAM